MSVDALVAESTAILEKWVADPAAVTDLGPALRLVLAAVEAFPEEARRRPARAALVNLTPVLLHGGLWDAVQDALARTVATEPDSPELRGRLEMLLSNMVHAVLARGGAEAADLPELWLALAEGADSAPLWETANAAACTVAVQLAQRGEWPLSGRALAPLRHVPARYTGELAPVRGWAYHALVKAALTAGQIEAAADALGELRALARFAELPAVDRSLAEALGHALKNPKLTVAVGRHAFQELAFELIQLGARHHEERGVAAALMRAAQAIAPAVLEHGAALPYLDAIHRCIRRWRADDGMVLAGAMGISHLARAARMANAVDPALFGRCAEILADLRGSSSRQAELLAITADFVELTGRPVPQDPRA